MTDILGTRATGRTDPLSATTKVADRGHIASKGLPERWTRTDRWYNFTGNVRGFSHVLATVDENTYTGGTNGFDHPIAWCKDYQGGRSFYTGVGGTPESFGEASVRQQLAGALDWAAGRANKTYSDCGATVLANYQQTKIAAPPNINEPIGFDQLPDGRIMQTVRDGRIRIHDPVTGSSTVIAHDPGLPEQRGRALRSGVRPELRAEPLGLLLLRPREPGGHLQQRLAVPAADTERATRRSPHRPIRRSGTTGRATSSSRGSSSSTGRARRSTSRASRRS